MMSPIILPQMPANHEMAMIGSLPPLDLHNSGPAALTSRLCLDLLKNEGLSPRTPAFLPNGGLDRLKGLSMLPPAARPSSQLKPAAESAAGDADAAVEPASLDGDSVP